MIEISLGGMILMLDNARIAKYYRVTWYVAIHKGPRSNHYVVPDLHSSHYWRIDSNPNIITKRGSTFSLSTILLANNNPSMDIDIPPNNGLRIDGDAIRVSDIQATTDNRLMA